MDNYIKNIINEMNRVQSNYGEDSLSVEEVLNIPAFEGCRLIAGASGINKRCKHLTILETPNGISWVDGGEFLVTAGYAFINDEDLKKSMMIDAHKKGISAIAIKEDRYFGEISNELIDQANKFEIPLIVLPYHVVYTRAISSFYNMLFYRKNEYILSLNNIYEKLLNLSFENKDINGIVYSLADLSNSNIFLFNSSCKTISNRTIKTNFNIPNITNLSEFVKGILINNKIYVLNKEVEKIFISIYPINDDNKVIAYLLIANDSKMDRLSQNSIEYGVSILSMKLKMDSTKLLVKTGFNKTLVEIMINKKDLPNDFYQNVENDLGWNYEGIIVGICIKIHANLLNNTEDSFLDVYNYLNDVFEDNNYLAIDRDNEIFIFNKFNSSIYIEDFVAKLYNHLKFLKENIEFSIGVSKHYKDIKNIEKLRDQAYLAALFSKQGIVYYNSLDTIKLLYPLKDDKEIQKYYGKTIKKLELYDKEHDSSLIKTLETYFRYNLQKTIVAEKLFIHVETLRYRLNKIESITGYSLSDSEGLFALQMGIKLKSIIKII